jgi:hypothetical protein
MVSFNPEFLAKQRKLFSLSMKLVVSNLKFLVFSRPPLAGSSFGTMKPNAYLQAVVLEPGRNFVP